VTDGGSGWRGGVSGVEMVAGWGGVYGEDGMEVKRSEDGRIGWRGEGIGDEKRGGTENTHDQVGDERICVRNDKSRMSYHTIISSSSTFSLAIETL